MQLFSNSLALWVKFTADDKLMIFYLPFLEKRLWYFKQMVSFGDNLHEMSKPILEKYFSMLSTENFTQSAKF